METTHGFGIGFGGLLGHFFIASHGIGKIVRINEVVAGVVGRIDIDHLHLPVVGGLQELQHLQIVALNVQILGGIPVYAFFGTGTQCAGGALLRQLQTLRLSLPLELVLFKIVTDILAAQSQQLINIQLIFGEALGK